MALNIGYNFADNYSFGIGITKNKHNFSLPSFNKIGDNSNQAINKVRNYATEGELIYEKKMDLDEDGTITFDEVKEYCKKNKVNLNEVLNKWQSYRILQNEQDVAKEIMKSLEEEDDETSDDELVYAKVGDEKYEAQMDTNKDKVVTYKEYNDYCAKHKENESKNDIKDIIKEYGLDENESDNSLKTEGNIEIDA